jgi:hypothetical protein
MDRLVALIVDESKWLTTSMIFALVISAILLYRYRHPDLPARGRILAAMNLFFGITIGIMAFGHLSAVTTKLTFGTLKGPVPLLYLIGASLALPSWWLTYHTAQALKSNADHGRTALGLNAFLAILLLGLGIHNLPIAAPAILNIGYQLHSARVVGWTIVCIAILVNAGLFIGSVMFFASGQSFEQFRGIQ